MQENIVSQIQIQFIGNYLKSTFAFTMKNNTVGIIPAGNKKES